MSDITCRVCGEPWDAWGARNGDLDREECQALVAGRGCPCCGGHPLCTCGHARHRHDAVLRVTASCLGDSGEPCACPAYQPRREA